MKTTKFSIMLILIGPSNKKQKITIILRVADTVNKKSFWLWSQCEHFDAADPPGRTQGFFLLTGSFSLPLSNIPDTQMDS